MKKIMTVMTEWKWIAVVVVKALKNVLYYASVDEVGTQIVYDVTFVRDHYTINIPVFSEA